jgi:hypothetical protein
MHVAVIQVSGGIFVRERNACNAIHASGKYACRRDACGRTEGQNMARERTARGKVRRRARTERDVKCGSLVGMVQLLRNGKEKIKSVSKQLKTVSVLRSFY